MTNVIEQQYWAKELDSFRLFRQRTGGTYRDWQPTKWQSLLRVRKQLIQRYGPRGTALELGCGSATLLLQLAEVGWRCTGVDLSSAALALASEAADSLGIEGVHFEQQELTEWQGPAADLVFSIGVIEHLGWDAQREMLRHHLDHSRGGVLVGVPNLDSPLFRSFIEWARRNDRMYEEEHLPTDVPALARSFGRTVQLHDGCHLFLSKADHYAGATAELKAFCSRLSAELVAAGGARYICFPRMDLGPEDIEVLGAIEARVLRADRLRFGFLTHYLIE